MKKSAYSFFKILICAIYIVSLVPHVTFAQVNLQTVLDKITAEMLTAKEPAYAITQDLPLLSTSLPDGVEAEYISSDESVLEITEIPATEEAASSIVGTVHRDAYEDKKVILTLTLSDESSSLSKNFNLKVLSKATTLYYSDSFYYPAYNGKLLQDITPIASSTPVRQTPSTTYGAGWQTLYQTELDETTDNGTKFRTTLESTDGEYALKGYRPVKREEYNYSRYVFNQKPQGKIEFTFRLKFEEEEPSQLYHFQLWGAYLKENGSIERRQALDIQIHRRENDGWISSASNAGVLPDTGVKIRPENGEWFTFSFCIDTNAQTFEMYYNDIHLENNKAKEGKPYTFYYETYDMEDYTKLLFINDFQTNSHRTTGGGLYYIDDMLVRTDGYYLERNKTKLELSDMLIFEEIAVINGNPVDIDNVEKNFCFKYPEEITSFIETNNLSIEWISEDEEVLNVNGQNVTVVQNNLDHCVNLTARIKDDSSDEYIEKVFNLKVLCKEEARQVNAAYNNLRAEIFTDEPPSAITKNLVPPSFDEVDISWAGSGTALSAEGVVKRGEIDIPATLTATISSKDASLTVKKSFSFTILAKEKKLFGYENFYHPENLNGEINSVKLKNWSGSKTLAETGARMTNTVIQDENYNYVLESNRSEANAVDYGYCAYKFPENLADKGSLSFKFRLLHEKVPQIYIIELNAYGSDSSGVLTEYQVGEIQLYYTKSSGCIKAMNPERVFTNEQLETNRWYTLRLDFDNISQTYELYIDGEKINDYSINYINSDKGIDFTRISSFEYGSYRKNESGKIQIDDVVLVGKEGVNVETVLFDNGEYRTTDATGVIRGVADIKAYVSNSTDSLVSGIVAVAGYDNDKLLWLKSKEISLSANSSSTIVSFNDMEIPFSESVKVKSFFFNKSTISPKSENDIAANSLSEMKPVAMTDSETGNSYKVLNMFGKNIMRCYYTQQCFSSDGTKLYFHDAQNNLYEYDIVKEEGRFIDRLLNDYVIVTSPLGNVFYLNNKREIIRMNCYSHEKEVVTSLPAEYTTGKASMLQIANDESRLSIEWVDNLIERDEEGNALESRFPMYDLIKGEWLTDITYGFDTEQYSPNHMSINPVRTNLMLFAHEGMYCKDRVWIMDMETGVPYNVFKQKQLSSIETGETAGHELWTYDGEKAAFVATGTRVGSPGGFTWVRYDGSDRRYINNDFSYCHVGIHPYTDRWAVGDTSYNGVTSNIVLIDCYTGESHVVATVHQTGENPGHCHPNFSFDGNTVVFGMYDDNDIISIGWADVSEIIENAPEVKTYSLSESCTIETAERENEVKKVLYNDTEAYKIPKNGIMRVQAKVAEKEKCSAEIKISYLDEGLDSIVLEYMVWDVLENGNNYLSRKTIELPCTDTKQTVTKTVLIDDINLENMEKLEGDFLLKASDCGAYITGVSVELK